MDTLDRSVAPAVRQIEARQLPEVSRETLPNGVELVVLDGGVQPVNRISFCWKAGSVDVDDLAAYHLLKPMLKEGTARRSGEEISDAFETCGAWVNVELGQHVTLLTAYMLNHTADEVLDVVCDMVSDATIPDEALAPLREKRSSMEELNRKKVKVVANMVSAGMTFGSGHPQNRFVEPVEYRGVTRERVSAVYESLIKGTVPQVYVCGKVDEELLGKIRRAVGRMPFGSQGVARRVLPAVFDACGAVCSFPVAGSLQTALKITIPTIAPEHPDYQLLRIAVFALGGYFGSRLMSNIREEKGYTYGISASLNLCREGSFVSVICETDNRYVDDVKREIAHEIRRLATEPMDGQELKVVCSTMMSQIAGMFDSPFSIMDHWMLIDSFGAVANATGERMRLLHTVTAGDLSEVVRKYLLEAPWLVASAGGAASESC